MKRAMFALAAVVGLLVAGCQDDNSVTEATTSAAARAGTYQKPAPTNNLIVLRGIMADPDGEKGIGVEITGQVWFSLYPVTPDKDEQFPKEQFDLTLQTEADVHSLAKDGFSFKVDGASTDRIVINTLNDSAPISLTKTYTVLQVDNQISLHLLFEITSTDVSVQKMWLTRAYIRDSALN